MNIRHLPGILFTVAAAHSAFPQGALSPPGAPGPTMKSLDELASRLEAANAKLDQADAKAEKRIPISSLPFTIDAPGSYYLTGNLTGVAGQNGITIAAKHVTVDLNGFRLAGPGQNGVFSSAEQIAVRNGSIDGWSISGIASAGKGALIDNIRASQNSFNGISVGADSVVQSCTVTNSGTLANGKGISATAGSIVSKCTVTRTSGNNATAISVGASGLVIDCTAHDNDAAGGAGIFGGSGSSIIRSQATMNSGTAAGIESGEGGRILDCISTSNSGVNNDGIAATSLTFISGCHSSLNGGDGIRVSNNCTVVNNASFSNTGDGFEVTGTLNRLDSNNATSNTGIGFRVDNGIIAVSNLIIRNSSANNEDAEYLIDANNGTGPIVKRDNVGTNTSPHANFDFDHN